jgi:hypothetical protein
METTTDTEVPKNRPSSAPSGYAPKQGEFFTIFKWLIYENDRSWCGDCLEARKVDGPFIRVRRHHDATYKSHFTLDSRNVQLMPLSDDFVQEVVNQEA